MVAKTFRASLLPENMTAADCSGRDGLGGSNWISSTVSAVGADAVVFWHIIPIPAVSVL